MCHSDFEYSLHGPKIATVTSAKPSWFIPLHSPILLHAVRPSFIFTAGVLSLYDGCDGLVLDVNGPHWSHSPDMKRKWEAF